MPANTVEATLTSRYIDQVTAPIERTRQMIQQNLHSMQQAGVVASSMMSAAFDVITGGANRLRDHFIKLSSESDSQFKKISFGAAAMAVAIGSALLMAAGSVVSWAASIAKEASEVTELKLAYEGLAASVGWNVDTLSRLKKETEGLVGTIDLARNANRVMQSGIKISSDQYVELTGNVFRLAKAAHVDGAQALTTLTDALIKGNARGLAAAGIHVNVRDAISEMALAAGQAASSMQDASKRQAFYAEMLEQTRIAVAKLPADFVSLDDALTRAEKSWRGMFLAIGEGINRSSVFQQLLQKLVAGLDSVGAKKSDIEQIALATNRFVIELLRVGATSMEVAGYVSTGIGVIWAAVEIMVNTVGAVVTGTLTAVAAVATGVMEVLAAIPGPQQRMFKTAAEESRHLMDGYTEATRQFAAGAMNYADGLGMTQAKLDAAAAGARTLAGELERVANQTVKATGGVQQTGTAAAAAAVDQKMLNEQLKVYNDLLKAARADWATPQMQAILEYSSALAKIEQLTLISESRKNALREAAFKAWARKMVEIEQQANNAAYDKLQDTLNLLRLVQESVADVKALKGPQTAPAPTNLGTDPAHVASNNAELQRQQEFRRIQEQLRASNDRNTPEWIKPLREAHIELQKLNQIGMDPFHQTMSAMKNSVIDFAGQAGQAFANFFSDLLSGQEGAGKKLLAAFVGMIGQMLVKNGVLLIQVGMAEMALASTMVGRFMGASHAAGAHAVAIGMIQAAIGGAMVGVASSMAQTNSASQSGTTFQNVPRATSSTQTQVIQVGAAGRAQSASETATSTTVKHELVLKLDKGVIVDTVKSNLRQNGELRMVVARATA